MDEEDVKEGKAIILFYANTGDRTAELNHYRFFGNQFYCSYRELDRVMCLFRCLDFKVTQVDIGGEGVFITMEKTDA
jgi:hypothetical protein